MAQGNMGLIWSGSSGCLLPFLIIFNLFFGRLIFDSAFLWLQVEALLILIFLLQIKFLVSRINRQFYATTAGLGFRSSPAGKHKPSGRIIDIQGQEINDNERPE